MINRSKWHCRQRQRWPLALRDNAFMRRRRRRLHYRTERLTFRRTNITRFYGSTRFLLALYSRLLLVGCHTVHQLRRNRFQTMTP